MKKIILVFLNLFVVLSLSFAKPERSKPDFKVLFNNGWSMDGRPRIQFWTAIGNSKWQVKFNGVDLKPSSDISEPYDNPYNDGLWEIRRHFLHG